jgi:uncharacterized protein YacL
MLKRLILLICTLSITILSVVFSFNSAFAACASTDPNCVDVSQLPQSSLLSNPGASTFDLILTLVFSLIGAIALIIITIAGFSYITSRGEPEKTARAKDTIMYAVIGLIVASLAATIVSFVAGYF